MEKMLLKKYESKKYKGEWFNLTPDDLLEIKKILRVFIHL
jgi:hypothetical protein